MKLIDIANFHVIEVDQEMTWDEAMASPAEANTKAVGGFTDWVLPDVITLKALASLKPEDSWFWSSSPHAFDSVYAWGVDFGGCYIDGNDKLNDGRVRLVRAGQCFDIGRAGQLESMSQTSIKLPD